MRSTLRARVDEVLFAPAYAGAGFAQVARIVHSLGPMAVFGGMLRDLAYTTASKFSSDVDLVVSTEDASELARRLDALGAQRNRYGGSHLAGGTWSIDVWALKDTWAVREGYVAARGFADLIRTTFFNWDAIVLDLNSAEFHYTTSYFDELAAGYLELNLEPNANPAGNVVRALRYLSTGRAIFGPRLTHYVHSFLTRALVEKELSVPTKYVKPLSDLGVVDLLARMEAHLRRAPESPFCR